MSRKPGVIILSGFLGSGKTTVLMQLLPHVRKKLGDDSRIAIIENEIGSASVDSGIIQDAGYSVTEMLAGCVCCTLMGQLVPSIQRLVEELDPDLIILEATGVATPESMRNNIIDYAGLPVRVMTLVDAARWNRIRIALEALLRNQIAPADVVCINKVDLVSDDELAEVENSVRAMNGSAPVMRICAAAPVDPNALDTLIGEW